MGRARGRSSFLGDRSFHHALVFRRGRFLAGRDFGYPREFNDTPIE